MVLRGIKVVIVKVMMYAGNSDNSAIVNGATHLWSCYSSTNTTIG